MLTHLYIRDLAIVDQLELTLRPGLTVLTGETGAGKSILIDALALALGERADTSVVRHGKARAEVIADFTLEHESDAWRWLHQQELAESDECILRRVVDERGSRAFINGRPVPVQMLRELGDLLVDIHGQHEHQSLLKRDAQRQLLDDFAGISAEVVTLGGHYEAMRKLALRLANLRQQSADRAAREEMLRYQVQELETLNLSKDELAALEDEHARLSYGADLLEGAQTTVQTLYDDEEQALSTRLGQCIHRLEQLARHDARLLGIAGLLNEAMIQVDEAASGLHQYIDDMELDPQRLRWVDERIADIHTLSRKHRTDAAALPELLIHLQQELADLENADHRVDELESELTAAQQQYARLAGTITEARKQAADALGHEVSQHMQQLGMPGGQFGIELQTLGEDEAGPTGYERINFQVSANPGQPMKPLTKVASGGELSRISLAIQVVIAGLGRIPSMIFDEVDVGIGGSVAEIVGRHLKALSQNRQVLCITHLAQVAAQGAQHLRVSKQASGDTTSTSVAALPAAERIQEIARMIGGVEISQQTLDHAEDMLSRASA